ncbi:MAG TPA: HNH endonuclease [Candidatus Obscuribacterales bacterium]
MNPIPESMRQRVRQQAGDRCGYCRSLQKYVLGVLEIEHILPKVAGGSDQEDNLWLACRLCNSYKGVQTQAQDPVTGDTVRLFNPRHDRWRDHFIWTNQGIYVARLTAIGRATVIALRLNNPYAVAVRQAWISAGWHPPVEPSS